MPYEIPTLGKLIADGEKDIAYELGLQKLPPVSVEQALNVSFSSQVRDLYDHQSWIKDQIIPSTASDDETIIKTATYEGVIRKQATFASGPVTFTSQSPFRQKPGCSPTRIRCIRYSHPARYRTARSPSSCRLKKLVWRAILLPVPCSLCCPRYPERAAPAR